MKLKYLFGCVSVLSLFLAWTVYSDGRELLALLFVAMGAASVFNAFHPSSNRPTRMREFLDLFVKPK